MSGERTRADKIEQLIRKKSTNPTAALAEFYIETKYDGDRFQLHRDKDQFMYFSRNGHDYTSVFGPDANNIGTLTPYIANTFKIDCEKCIIGKLFNFENNFHVDIKIKMVKWLFIIEMKKLYIQKAIVLMLNLFKPMIHNYNHALLYLIY